MKILDRSRFIPGPSKRGLRSGELTWQFINLTPKMVTKLGAIQPEVDPPLPMGKDIVFVAERREIDTSSGRIAVELLSSLPPRF